MKQTTVVRHTLWAARAAWLRRTLRCPRCRGELEITGEKLRCERLTCGTSFPIVGGVPILINETRSVFQIKDIVRSAKPAEHSDPMQRLAAKLLPSVSANLRSGANYERLVDSLRVVEAPKVLIIGGGTLGKGMATLVGQPGIEVLETDVYIGPRTAAVCDAHDLPFTDSSFDAVVVQAVLEHVLDPARCVQEIHRVLKTGGYVYAETPFMQQVHLGRCDFTRFTDLGHRWLFRSFEELDRGINAGPGTTLAWAYVYFLRSMCSNRIMRGIATAIGHYTAFWLKYLDRLLVTAGNSREGASCLFFWGRKVEFAITERDILEYYTCE